MGKNLIIFSTVLLMAYSHLWGQEEKKEEFRASWVASVANIDWPKYEHRNDPEAQKADLIRMMDQFRSLHMNAILLQIRTECDALYLSSYEPWSRYLGWNQGDDPGYDPLAFALEEAHLRGIELHAWLNPYRINASTSDSEEYYHPTHIYREHPEWAIEYPSGKKILNPGRPEVMSYIGSIVHDIITNYAVDGIHFDDYFYAYEGTEVMLDSAEYRLYGNGKSLGDWRRENVNRMIDTVNTVIQKVNPSIRFGVSPFGIYRNGVPDGITGFDAYSVIYCDPMAWLRSASIDYLTPQTYWPTGGPQDFETLVNWWADSLAHYGRHLIPGQASYRLSVDPGLKKTTPGTDTLLHELKYYVDAILTTSEKQGLKGTGDPVAAWTLSQLGLQIDLIRACGDRNGMGSIFFSAKDFTRVSGLSEYLRKNKFTHPTLMPEMTWKADDTPEIPQNLRTSIINDAYYLTWDHNLEGNERIAIYVSDHDSIGDTIILVPGNLQEISFGGMIPLSELVISTNSRIVVTAVSATGRESGPSTPLELDADMPLAVLTSPEDGDTVSLDTELTWSSSLSAPLYQLQVAAQSSFSEIAYASPWTADTSISLDTLGLEGESEYFWRVSAKEDVTGPYSAARSFFTGFPSVPLQIAPENLGLNISTSPLMIWNASPLTDSILVEVSEAASFIPLVTSETFDASTGKGTLHTKLSRNTWYYTRLQGFNEKGRSEFSRFCTFMTTAGEIPEVILLSPEESAKVASFDTLEWETTATEGSITYQLEVALDESFSIPVYKSSWISAKELTVSEMNLEGNRNYLWRVKAKSEFGQGAYSEMRSFISGYPERPSITEPAHLSEGVAARPVIGWSVGQGSDSVFVEISETSDFTSLTHREPFSSFPGSQQISASLKGFTWYYCRIQAGNIYGRSVFSAKKLFMTGEGTGIGTEAEQIDMFLIRPTIFTGGKLLILCKVGEPCTLYLFVNDQMGREIFRETLPVSTGETVLETQLDRSLFPGQGIYLVRTVVNEVPRNTLILVQ